MNFILLCSLINYKSSFSLEQNQSVIYVQQQFILLENGTYIINYNGNINDSFLLYIDAKEKVEEYYDKYNDIITPCNISYNLSNIYILNGIGSINGKMKHEGYYNVILKSCFPFNGECFINMEIDNSNANFSNGDKFWISYMFITGILSTVFFLKWITKNYSYITRKNMVVLFFSFYYIFFIIEKFQFIYYYYYCYKTDKDFPKDNYLISQILTCIFYYITMFCTHQCYDNSIPQVLEYFFA